jgi:hypothetical protein
VISLICRASSHPLMPPPRLTSVSSARHCSRSSRKVDIAASPEWTEQALYGAFEVKHIFYVTLYFLRSSFFVRLGIPFLRPAPHVLRPTRTGPVKVGRRSDPGRALPSFPGRALTGASTAATLAVVGTMIRGGACHRARSSRHNLVFGRSVVT